MIIHLVRFISCMLIFLIFNHRRLFWLKEEDQVFDRTLVPLCDFDIGALIGFSELPLLLKFDPLRQVSYGSHDQTLPSDRNSSRGHLQLFGLFLSFIFKILEFRLPRFSYHIFILNFSYIFKQALRFVWLYCYLIRRLRIIIKESIVNTFLGRTIAY